MAIIPLHKVRRRRIALEEGEFGNKFLMLSQELTSNRWKIRKYWACKDWGNYYRVWMLFNGNTDEILRNISRKAIIKWKLTFDERRMGQMPRVSQIGNIYPRIQQSKSGESMAVLIICKYPRNIFLSTIEAFENKLKMRAFEAIPSTL